MAANIILQPRFTGLLATLQTMLELMGGLLLPKSFFLIFIELFFLPLCRNTLTAGGAEAAAVAAANHKYLCPGKVKRLDAAFTVFSRKIKICS